MLETRADKCNAECHLLTAQFESGAFPKLRSHGHEAAALCACQTVQDRQATNAALNKSAGELLPAQF
jgi:hypothetical protein